MRAVLRSVPAILLFCSLAAAQESPSAPRTVLLLPFENVSKVPGIAWIGESFPEVIGRGLASPPLLVIERDERLYAFERLGIPSGARLSRATMFRIGEAMDLDYLIVGRYQFDGRVFTARAQVLDLKSLRLSPETEQSGALVDLMEIQSNLAWNLLVMIAAEPPTSHEQFIQGFPRVRLDALENYVRGLLAPRRQDRVRHLREAVRLHPEYSQARLQLGKALFEARDYGGAAAAFARILQEDGAGIGPQAQFHLGLSVYYLGDFTRAADAFRSFAERAPLPEAFNNMGVAAARRGDAAAAEHFRRAVESAPKDPDYRFNLGVALYRTGDLKEAAQHLREAVTLQPGDAEAAALLQVISTPAGSSPPAAVRVPLERIRRTYDEADFRQLSLVQPGRP